MTAPRSGGYGAKEVVIGRAHRGRLNVLINILGKNPSELFDEFEGRASYFGSGEVKYHQGFSSNIMTPGGEVHLALAFNPSHLEIVSPVVEGSVRARQDRRKDTIGYTVVPLVIHGDAAFAGQGVVMETFQMSQTRGFYTGGTLHIIINNQILDFQTQVFLALQSLQSNAFDDPNRFNSAQELRNELESGRDGLPLNAKPRSSIQTIDHLIPTEFGELNVREYCPERILIESPILYFHGGGYVLGSINTHDPWLKFFSAEIGAKIFSLYYRLATENKFPSSFQVNALMPEFSEFTKSL